jgi:hypothetical protein
MRTVVFTARGAKSQTATAPCLIHYNRPVRRILRHWLIFISLFALLGEPLIADAHLSIDGDICSVSPRGTGSSQPKSQNHQHNHDCCVAISVLSKTGASEFSWHAESFSFVAPVSSAIAFVPVSAWQLQRSRAPPVFLA